MFGPQCLLRGSRYLVPLGFVCSWFALTALPSSYPGNEAEIGKSAELPPGTIATPRLAGAPGAFTNLATAQARARLSTTLLFIHAYPFSVER